MSSCLESQSVLHVRIEIFTLRFGRILLFKVSLLKLQFAKFTKTLNYKSERLGYAFVVKVGHNIACLLYRITPIECGFIL